MGILSWMRRWFAKRKSEPRSTFLPGNSGDLVPNLFVRQLEERRVLNGVPLVGQDDVRELFVSAGSGANDGQADTFLSPIDTQVSHLLVPSSSGSSSSCSYSSCQRRCSMSTRQWSQHSGGDCH